MPKLTKRLIDGLAPEAKDRMVWDTEIRGFGLRVQPSGVKSFVVQYRNDTGRSRRLTLGRYGILTVEMARREAQVTLGETLKGGDPSAERQTRRAAPTLDALLDRYLAEHVDRHNGVRMQAEVRRTLKNHVRPGLGALKVLALTRQDVIRFHNALSETPRQANFALAVLSKAFGLAELWGWRPDGSNPCRKVARYLENERERFLTPDELGQLGAALHEAETVGLPWKVKIDGPKAKHLAAEEKRRSLVSDRALAVIRMLLLTGARLSEILTLRLEHVDTKAGTLALPGRKGGKRTAHPVGTAAMELLTGLPWRAKAGWVFPRSSDAERHVTVEVVESAWSRVRARAGIPDVRLHDLRHTVGTYAAQSGVNAFIVRDLLRHRNIAVTSRYANRDASPIRAVSDLVGERIIQGLAKRPQPPGD